MDHCTILRTEALRLDYEQASVAFEIAIAKCILTERKYRSNQLRAPAGTPNGGQWILEIQRNLESDYNRIKLAADITGFTKHGINQAINRGVSPSSILDAVKNPVKIEIQPNGTTRYIGGSAVVVINPAGGVVTVWGQ